MESYVKRHSALLFKEDEEWRELSGLNRGNGLQGGCNTWQQVGPVERILVTKSSDRPHHCRICSFACSTGLRMVKSTSV